jgi:flagellar basal body rod protein FlgC
MTINSQTVIVENTANHTTRTTRKQHFHRKKRISFNTETLIV